MRERVAWVARGAPGAPGVWARASWASSYEADDRLAVEVVGLEERAAESGGQEARAALELAA